MIIALCMTLVLIHFQCIIRNFVEQLQSCFSSLDVVWILHCFLTLCLREKCKLELMLSFDSGTTPHASNFVALGEDSGRRAREGRFRSLFSYPVNFGQVWGQWQGQSWLMTRSLYLCPESLSFSLKCALTTSWSVSVMSPVSPSSYWPQVLFLLFWVSWKLSQLSAK